MIKLFSGPGKRIDERGNPADTESAGYAMKSHIRMVDFETLLSWKKEHSTIEAAVNEWNSLGTYSQKRKSLKFLQL